MLGDYGEADYNLWENLQMLAPDPKRMKQDITFKVERVVKGEFVEKTLKVHWLRSPTEAQSKKLGIPYFGGFAAGFTNGTPLNLGFDTYSGRNFKNLKISVRPQ